MAVDMQPIASSNIAEAGYDPAARELSIRFHSGDTYTYCHVPPEVHAGLRAAKSAGRYFHEHIKPTYSYRRTG